MCLFSWQLPFYTITEKATLLDSSFLNKSLEFWVKTFCKSRVESLLGNSPAEQNREAMDTSSGKLFQQSGAELSCKGSLPETSRILWGDHAPQEHSFSYSLTSRQSGYLSPHSYRYPGYFPVTAVGIA